MGLTEINHSGMPKWLEAWRHRDMLLGRAVVVDGTPPVAGIAAGIDDSGALLLHTETGIARWQAGRYPCCKLETRYDAGAALVVTGCG